MRENIILTVFVIGLLLMLAVIVCMFRSLARQEDERRARIVGEASTKTFAIVVLYIAFCVVKDIYKVLSGTDLSPKGINPFVLLTTISFIYAVELIYHKKKYGD